MSFGNLLDGHGKTCPDNEELRRLWGCDAETDDPQYSAVCYCDNRATCSVCEGTGEIVYRRCPLVILQQAQVGLVLSLYCDTKEQLPLIDEGPLLDQSATWLEAKRFLDGEYNAITEEKWQNSA